MDIKAQKDRLEQELRFLKESFEAEVISKEEFEKGKERIERKLNELEFMHKSDVESKIEEQKKESRNELPDTTEEPLSKEDEEEAEPEEREEDESETYAEKHSQTGKSSGSGFWKYATILLILIMAALIAFNYINSSKTNTTAKAAALCSSDAQCIELGKIGKCIDPGLQSAKCQFSDIDSVKVIVLTDKDNCINCDTSRVLSILNEWIGPLNASEVSYSTQRGKELAQKYGADILPLFIVDVKVEERPSFSQFQRSFAKRDDAYILSEKVAGASVYVNRQEIPEKVDLFVKEGDSSSKKAEDNLAEFLSNFDARYEKHPSTSALSKELGLNIFPTFLINNKAAFSGVHTADSIKQNYCKLNDDSNCDKTLSTSLK